MPKQPLRKGLVGRRAVKRPAPAQETSAAPQVAAEPAGSFETLKQNMKKIDKGSMFDALKRVKDMKPEAWKDPNEVRRLTESIAQGIGIRVDPRRIDAFMNAYKDATKNSNDKGPKVSVEDIARKYAGQAVDDKTIKEIKKFVK